VSLVSKQVQRKVIHSGVFRYKETSITDTQYALLLAIFVPGRMYPDAKIICRLIIIIRPTRLWS